MSERTVHLTVVAEDAAAETAWLARLDELFGRFVTIHAELMDIAAQILEEIPRGSVYGFDEERVTQRYAGRLSRLTKEERMTIGPIFRERLSQRQVGIICGVGRSAIRNDELRSRRRSSPAERASEDHEPEESMTTLDQTLARIDEFLDAAGSAETRVRPGPPPETEVRQCSDSSPHAMHLTSGGDYRCPDVMRLGTDADWVPAAGDRSPKAAKRRRQIITAMNEARSSSPQIGQRLGISAESVRSIARKMHLTISADELIAKTRAPRGPDFMVEAMINDLSALVPSFDMISVGDLDREKLPAWARIFRSAARDINEFALKIERELKPVKENKS